MAQDREISYFRIGSFVMTGIILLVIAILVLGSGMLFKRVVYVETYFNESVQGLTVGSPVKYLGMEIGHVVEINAVDSIYKVTDGARSRIHNAYVYVKMAISPKFFDTATKEEVREHIQKDITSGLRFKLAPQGLTGNVYIELDFLNPKTHPKLSIYWTPENLYIPSTTSTLTYFTDNVQYLLGELKKIDVKKMANNVQTLLNNTNKLILRADRIVSQTSEQTINTVNNMQSVSGNLNAITEQAKAFPSHMLFGKPPPPLKPGKL